MGDIERFAFAGLLTMLLVLSPACAAAPSPIDTEPDLIGFVTEIRPAAEKNGYAHVFVESHADRIVSRYDITMTGDTLIFRQDGEALRAAALKTLENKHWVNVWFAGPTSESYPVQVTAAQMIIIGFQSQ